MALVLADDTIDIFTKFTRFDITAYFKAYTDFIDNDYESLLDYYNGGVAILDQEAIGNLKSLTNLSGKLEDILINTAKSFDRVDFWNLISFIDEMRTKIKVINKLSKFVRSTTYDGFNETSISVDHNVSSFDTPETIAAKDRPEPQNDWVDIYVKNHVLETDYQAEVGGYNLLLGRQNLGSLNIVSVVDNLVGDRIYGKDLDKRFYFADNDLVVLTPRRTVTQSVNILGGVQKGDIPEVVEIGKSADVVIGSNLGLFSIPSLSREMKEAFSTDDTLINFQIKEISIEASALYVGYEVETFNNFVVQDNIVIR